MGKLGVSVFFVISGFLITRLLIEERRLHGKISLRGFFRRRVFRIIPAYFVFLAAMVVAWKLGRIDLSWPQVGAAAAFVWNYAGLPGWTLAHTWSLAIEEQFYLFWPLVLALVGPRRALWFAI